MTEGTWEFVKRVVPPGPQPEPQCPHPQICSQCFPGEPCRGAACHVCTVVAARQPADSSDPHDHLPLPPFR